MSADSDPIPRVFSRRRLLGGLGGAVAAFCFDLTRLSMAQVDGANDGFRLLTAKPASAMLPGSDAKPFPVSAYDGAVPGPLLRVRRGGEIKVRLLNALAEPTTIHWHGMRITNAMDGATPLTQAAVEPGKTFDYRFVATDAGTFWYHPPEPSGPGLYGMVIVDEPEPLDVDRDAAIILADGPAEAGEIIVNGARAFQIPVQSNERIRLRLLNAASTRPFSVRIDGHRAFVMAVDGQPAEPFAARDARAVLGPGNRVDLFVDCTMATGATAPVLVDSAAGAVAVAHLVYSGEGGRPSVRAEPKPLPANPLPERMDFNRALRTELSFAEAAPSALPSRPLFSAKRGRTVVVNIVNRATAVQVTHVHGHAFRLLDRLDDGWKPFWLDTIAIPPQSNDRIAFVADNPGKWLIRTRVQQSSSLAWFEVA